MFCTDVAARGIDIPDGIIDNSVYVLYNNNIK